MSIELEKVLDLRRWEAVQESIAIATKLAIILVDYKGRPVTYHSQVQPFCQLARQDPVLSKLCEKCDARGGLEAVRTGQPFIYRCHFDIIDMAIPIMVDNHYVGAIMAGEVRLKEQQEQLEQVLTADRQLLDSFIDQHQADYQQYPLMDLQDLENAAQMLEKLSEYIVTEAIKKDYLVKAYQKSLNIVRVQPVDEPTESLELVQKDLHQSLLTQRLDDQQVYRAKNKLLQPAIDAIFANKENHLKLETLAQLTNLSTSYLSRLLKEEFGQPFSQMYARLKIYWAKQLLIDTDQTIAEISDALGYVEPSYFVRTFKKIEGTTPLKYRKTQL